MALITWNDDLKVNILEIDGQHERLVGMINELNDAMRQGKGKDVLSRILDGLVTYASTHFGTEEKLFDRHGYPERAAHRGEHQDFAAKVVDFKSKYDSGRIGLSIEIMTFLGDWLKNHIKGSDASYSPFLREHGVR